MSHSQKLGKAKKTQDFSTVLFKPSITIMYPRISNEVIHVAYP